mgnify:CR=1 FL=1
MSFVAKQSNISSKSIVEEGASFSMFRRIRWKLIVPIMVVVFFGAMFVVNQFYPTFPEEDRLTMYIWAAMISGVMTLIMFPTKEQEEIRRILREEFNRCNKSHLMQVKQINRLKLI